MFFMAEWGNLYIIGALVSLMFLGGWQLPVFTDVAALQNGAEALYFVAKSYFWVLFSMWVRATLPRVRVDQLMTICWKYLVPIAFVNLIGTAVWMVIFPHGFLPARLLLFAFGTGAIGYFFYRVLFHLRRARVRERGWFTLNPLS
jgi:NADH-quinone oxidoreductase subunit H